MSLKPTQITTRQAALTAGISLFLMIAAVMVAFPFTTSLITGDATQTMQAIRKTGAGFQIGILGWFVVLALDIIVAWALYVYFKPVHEGYSLLTGWFRLFYTALFGTALLSLVLILLMLQGKSYLGTFSLAQQNSLAFLFLKFYKFGWLFALGFFGIHLFGLGILAIRSSEVPTVFGILLVVAAFGYFGQTVAYLTMPNYAAYESTITAIVAAPNAIGEIALAIWLVAKGGKQKA